jgi:hypothetical protein
MGMRPHIQSFAKQEFSRPHLIEKDERPHHLTLRRGKGAAHLEATEIARTRHDHSRDRVAGMTISGQRVLCRLPAH